MDSFKLIFNKLKSKLLFILSAFFAYIAKVFVLLKFKKQNLKPVSPEKMIDLDKKLVYSLSKSRIPTLKQLKYIKKYLTKKELLLIRTSILVIILSILTSGFHFYFTNLQEVPVSGGEYVEGLIGMPKYVNPLYSGISDTDSDISSLIFSSLFKRGKNGELEKDLVESYELSEDNKAYTFTIKQNVNWHGGGQLTVDDIIFTFNSINDARFKSPLRLGFGGVEIERIDDNKIGFTLADPYAAFLELLTFGILPADLWYQISPEAAGLHDLNLRPIGSGPYSFKDYTKDKLGNIKEYRLVPNQEYYGAIPYIDLTFKFFPSFEELISALNNNTVDGISYLPQDYKKDVITPKALNYHKLYLPQLVALFINQGANPILGDKSSRQALAYAINRNEIINNVLDGDAYLVDGPILADSFAYNNELKKYDYNLEKASELLDNIDWKLVSITSEMITQAEEDINSEDEKTRTKAEKIIKLGEGNWREKDGNYFIIKMTTIERSENTQVVEEIKNNWEKIGIKADIEILSASQLQSQVIKSRDFEILFYSQIVGGDPDPYAFWHSSQAAENGYNIANFKNKEVDELLEDARITSDRAKRQENYKKFQEIITEEVPTIFMYSPMYNYVQRKKVKGFEVKNILLPSDRFLNINEWYINTGKKLVWE